tara:strand:- start:11010 stop:12167 length:1158 start_codon:yes stop_codon:yes gene_type:complete
MINLLNKFMISSNQNSSNFHLVIQTNSPGELAAWVQPIVETCVEFSDSCFITICLVPCQYATGNEADVAAAIPGVQHVLTAKQTILFLFGLMSLPKHANKGAVLCLGGDPFYSQLLGFRLGFPSSIYTEHRKKPGLFFKHIFYKHQQGDLMQARVAHYQDQNFAKNHVLKQYHLPTRSYVLLFLGSRPNHFLAFADLIVPMIKHFLSLQDTIDIIIPIAPTISDRDVEVVNKADLGHRVHIVRGNSLDFMSIAICMMSLPGTNTAEAMYMGLPMVTVVPLNRLDLLSLDGLLGLLASIPLVGAWLKRLLVPLLLKKVAFVSLPNRVAQKSIVPEWIGMIDPTILADDFYQFVSNQAALDAIKCDLAKIVSQPDVDRLIIKQIFED